jgi:3D-(3,5/4)-trihydroxycyclohexane-1,2-dione acylhydrolase (decyclizing)
MCLTVSPAMQTKLSQERLRRAQAIIAAGSIEHALAAGTLPKRIDTTLSEVIVLGLLRQDVRIFFCVLGHGSTEIGEVLRIYQQAGLVRVCGVRSEIEASHAAMACVGSRAKRPQW